MTCCRRLFHTRDAATGNDRSPMGVRRVRRITSIDDDAERSLRRAWESLKLRHLRQDRIYTNEGVFCLTNGTHPSFDRAAADRRL